MDFQEWKSLPDEQRREISRDWSPYETQAIDGLLEEIVVAFRRAYPSYEISGVGNVHGSLELVVRRPFIFDQLAAPDTFMGLPVRYSLSEPLPEGFEIYRDYVWAPENYLQFVNDHASQISRALGQSGMGREEMLSALVGMPFDAWIRQCQECGNTKMSPGERTVPAKPWWKLW